MPTSTTTRKPAQANTAAPRRPAFRASAGAASVGQQPPGPSSSLEDSAAYAIGYHAGMAEGQRIGAERERARLNTDEEIGDHIERLMALEIRPRALRALDHAVSWLIYAVGVAGIVAGALIIWRLSKWI